MLHTIEDKKHLLDLDPFLYNLVNTLIRKMEFINADLKYSIENLGERIGKLEQKSHIHITDTVIHKGGE